MKSNSKILLVALAFSAYCCSPKGDGSVTIVEVGDSKMAVLSLNELNSNEVKIPLNSFNGKLRIGAIGNKRRCVF